MAAASERATVAPGRISFELERFERVDGRLELRGRWFAVRGMRFVRPTLTLTFEDGSRSRALADLEHKPWAPSDGELWQAAFPCPAPVAVLDAELAVAPGIALPLPAPGDALPDADPIAVLPPAPAEPKGNAASAPARRKRAAVADELAALREETQRLRQEPIRLQTELARAEQLRKDVEGELERLKLNADGAVARRDAAVERYEDVADERDEAVRELGDAVSERNEAVRERDAAVRARDEARRERDAAVQARDAAVQARDETARQRDASVAKRDEALAKGGQATSADRKAAAERDAAIAARDKAFGERDAALSARDRAVAERDQATAERDRARTARSPGASPRTVQLPRTVVPGPIFSEHRDQLIKRALAIAVLAVAGLALLIILGVL